MLESDDPFWGCNLTPEQRKIKLIDPMKVQEQLSIISERVLYANVFDATLSQRKKP